MFQHVHTVTLIKTDWELENNFGDGKNGEGHVQRMHVEAARNGDGNTSNGHNICAHRVSECYRISLVLWRSLSLVLYSVRRCVVDRHTRLVMASPLQSVLNGILFCFFFFFAVVNEYLVRLVCHATHSTQHSEQHQCTQKYPYLLDLSGIAHSSPLITASTHERAYVQWLASCADPVTSYSTFPSNVCFLGNLYDTRTVQFSIRGYWLRSYWMIFGVPSKQYWLAIRLVIFCRSVEYSTQVAFKTCTQRVALK